MRCRIFEVRLGDDVYSVMALEMSDEVSEMRVWLLGRAGFKRDQPNQYQVTILDTEESHFDFKDWSESWQRNLHKYVEEQFNHIYDGKVIDLDHLMAERDSPRLSSRAT